MARRRLDYDDMDKIRGVEQPDTHITVEKMEAAPKAHTLETKVPMPIIGRNKIRITVLEAVDMLAGYQMSDRAFIDFKEESGKCLFCGKKTNSPTRNICNDCDKKYNKAVYEGLVKALADGEDSFTINY